MNLFSSLVSSLWDSVQLWVGLIRSVINHDPSHYPSLISNVPAVEQQSGEHTKSALCEPLDEDDDDDEELGYQEQIPSLEDFAFEASGSSGSRQRAFSFYPEHIFPGEYEVVDEDGLRLSNHHNLQNRWCGPQNISIGADDLDCTDSSILSDATPFVLALLVCFVLLCSVRRRARLEIPVTDLQDDGRLEERQVRKMWNLRNKESFTSKEFTSDNADNENGIKRSQKTMVTPLLQPDLPLSSPESSPESFTRLSEELNASIGVDNTNAEFLKNEFGPFSLDSSSMLELEGIQEGGAAGGQSLPLSSGDVLEASNVKFKLRVTKRPKSTDLEVSSRDILDHDWRRPHAMTWDLEECVTEPLSLFSAVTTDFEYDPTDLSTSGLVRCITETTAGESAAFRIHEDEPNDITKPTSPMRDLNTFGATTSQNSSGGTVTGWDSSSTLKTENTPGVENACKLSPISESAKLLTTPSKIPVLTLANKSIDSRRPLASPSLRARLKETNKANISEAVHQYFFDPNRQGDGELFLCEVFGPDPPLETTAPELESLSREDIESLIDTFVGKETSDNWALRANHVDVLIAHLRLRLPEKHFEYFQEKINGSLEDILTHASTPRGKLLAKMVIFIRDLVYFGSDIALSNENFAVLIHLLLPFTRASMASKHIQNLTTKSLCLMLQSITTRSLIKNFELIFQGTLSDRKMKGEKYACLFMIKFYLLYNQDKIIRSEMVQIVRKLIPLVANLSIDAYQKTRSETVELYLVLLKILGPTEELQGYYDALGSYLRLRVPSPV